MNTMLKHDKMKSELEKSSKVGMSELAGQR